MRRAGRRLAALACVVAAPAFAGLQVDLQIGRLQAGGTTLRDLQLRCQLQQVDEALSCRDAALEVAAPVVGTITARADARLARDGSWQVALASTRSAIGAFTAGVEAASAGTRYRAHLASRRLALAPAQALAQQLGWALPGQLSGHAAIELRAAAGDDGTRLHYRIATDAAGYSEPSGRHAAEKLGALLLGEALWHGARGLSASLELAGDAGQLYLEPVFVDLDAEPLQAKLRADADAALLALRIRELELRQRGIGRAGGTLRLRRTAAAVTLDAADLALPELRLGPAFARYAAPFFVGGRWADTALSGSADLALRWSGGALSAVRLDPRSAGIEVPALGIGMAGIDGVLHWSAAATPAEATRLAWRAAHWGELPMGAATLRLVAAGRFLRLLDPLRIPVLDGALRVQRLELSALGQPQATARFQAEIEPIDLAALCRALGWPEFGGQLSGRLPGLSLDGGELRLDGGLAVRAFDGELAIDRLRVLDAFGRLPRLLADIRLRNLDLAEITRAFSFGLIEGRISGEVEQLRLLDWRPVAFRARLYTPPGDRSRHRISQRAIDNISAIGGGPTGLLSRGALRFFEDFGYRRIGWSCVLANGVCRMDGIRPTDDGGYVLVEGRLLPRIDVIGYGREVAWDRFVAQLLATRGAGRVELR